MVHINHSLRGRSSDFIRFTGLEDYDADCQEAGTQGQPCNAEDHTHQVLSLMGILCRSDPAVCIFP